MPTQTPGPVVQAEGEPEAVIVTAFRRETLLQDTPISLGVINTDEIEKRHVQSLHDLAEAPSRACASRPTNPARRR